MRLVYELPLEGIAFFAMYMLAPLFRNSKRIAGVKNERTFQRLRRTLMRQVRPSLYSFLSGEQAFNIRSTDEWWQDCIAMLMHSCEIVVVDLSWVKEGTAWELNELHQRALLTRCIFVAGEAGAGNLAATVAAHFDSDTPPSVFLYGNDGRIVAADADQFSARLTRSVARGATGWGGTAQTATLPSWHGAAS